MGIRLYINEIEKINEIQLKTKCNHDEIYEHFSKYSKQLYQLDFNYLEQLDNSDWGIQPFSLDSDGYGYYKMTKQTLIEFIKDYESKILLSYKNLFNDSKKNDFTKINIINLQKLGVLASKSFINYNKNENGEVELTKSNFLEHCIFNLVFILKTFDFDKKNLYLYLA